MHNTSRRSFIKESTTAAIGLSLINMMDAKCTEILDHEADIEIYATDWGFAGSTEEFCAKAKAAGYDGIELWIPQDDNEADNLLEIVNRHNLKLGLLAGNSGSTFDEHFSYFEKSISKALRLQPEFINCHAGKDYFTFDQNKKFIDHTMSQSKNSGIPIYHETHRGRILFCTPIAAQFIDAYESLELTLDISHWCCVHESLLQDQKEVIEKVLMQTSHIHSRVGFAEAPQIPDPNDPQWKEAVDAHFSWWDTVVKYKSDHNQKLTMTAEFGPPPYMWTQLGSGDPVADVWDVNLVMKDLWIKRYNIIK